MMAAPTELLPEDRQEARCLRVTTARTVQALRSLPQPGTTRDAKVENLDRAFTRHRAQRSAIGQQFFGSQNVTESATSEPFDEQESLIEMVALRVLPRHPNRSRREAITHVGT